jgi:hypothetical protein
MPGCEWGWRKQISWSVCGALWPVFKVVYQVAQIDIALST